MAEAQNYTGFRAPEPLILTGNVAENYSKFKSRFDVFMIATGNSTKTDEVKITIFLNLIGEEAHEVFNTLNLTVDERKCFNTVLGAMERYCMPRKNEIYNRYLFYSRDKDPDEPFDHFLTNIKKLIRQCDFSDNDSMLRDRIVLGINNGPLQEKLLRIADLTLEKTVDYCQAAEMAQKQIKKLQGEQKVDAIQVNKRIMTSVKGKNVTNNVNNMFDCVKCGRRHIPRNCPAFGKTCNRCKRQNHFAVGCNKNYSESNYNDRSKRTAAITYESDSDTESLVINALTKDKSEEKPWFENIIVGGKVIKFKLDCGSEVNVLPLHVFTKMKLQEQCKVRKSKIGIIVYGGKKIKPVGSINILCKIKNMNKQLEFVIMDVMDTPILSRQTCTEMKLIKRLQVITISKKDEFIKSNSDIFTGMGCYPLKQKIVIRKDAVPTVRPAYRVAESLRARLKQTLDQYEKRAIISRVNEPTPWVHNLAIIEKNNKKLRLCLDPKEINNVIRREHYPIPILNEITPKLAKKKFFTVMDMKDGFFHLQLDECSSRLCTFHTPYGRYKFNRMPFGIASAPEIFQKITAQIFGEIEGVVVYFDDIIIAADSERQHDLILEEVVKKAKQYNFRFNKDKLQFKVNKVRYLGQMFSEEGMSPDPDGVKAILKLKAPENKAELQSFLGMANYMGKYIPNLSEISYPLRSMLKKEATWEWSLPQEEAMAEIKNRIARAPTLKCFLPGTRLTIQSDASQYGIGCCLLSDGHPLGFASRSLSSTEKGYAQIEKELLSIVYACKKFHTFIYGHPNVTVNTDHKPLESIVKKDIGKISKRLQRMCLCLLKYDLTVKYIPGRDMLVADLLSRNVADKPTREQEPIFNEIVHAVERVLPISKAKLSQYQTETEKDQVLSRIKHYLMEGWPPNEINIQREARWAWKVKDQLEVKDDLILLEGKIVIPKNLQKEILNLLHKSHYGIVKTKKRARQAVYWKGMTSDIEALINQCRICERFRLANTKEPLIQRETPVFPFEVVAADICTFAARDYLVMACNKTRWLDIVRLESKTATEVIDKLKVYFANHGIPRVLMSDNMPFASKEFKNFTRLWGIEQSLSSPRYPRSNGFAEKMVGVAKMILKKTTHSEQDLQMALLDYRNSPIEGMAYSPAQLAMARILRTTLPMTATLLKHRTDMDDIEQDMKIKEKQRKYYNLHTKLATPFNEGDSALVRREKEWEPVIIKEVNKSPRSYIVTNREGNDYRRNRLHLRKSHNPPITVDVSAGEEGDDIEVHSPIAKENMDNVMAKGNTPPAELRGSGIEEKVTLMTRSGRLIKRPAKLKDYI